MGTGTDRIPAEGEVEVAVEWEKDRMMEWADRLLAAGWITCAWVDIRTAGAHLSRSYIG